MKYFALSLAAALSVAVAAPVASAQSVRGNFREARQEQRIRIAGMRGQLSRWEYNTLMRGQARIDALQNRAARDGVVTPWEARSIERAQDIENARIQRLSHNGRGRY
jgi:hypothetical protein